MKKRTIVVLGGRATDVPSWLQQKCEVVHFPKPEKGGVIDLLSRSLPERAELVVVLRHCDHPSAKSAKDYAKGFNIPVLTKVTSWAYVANQAKGRKDMRWFWHLWERRNGVDEAELEAKPKPKTGFKLEWYETISREVVAYLALYGPMTAAELRARASWPAEADAGRYLWIIWKHPFIEREPSDETGPNAAKWRYGIAAGQEEAAFVYLKAEKAPPFTMDDIQTLDGVAAAPPPPSEPPTLAKQILATIDRIRADLDLLETAALELNKQLEAADNEVSDLEGMRELLEDMIEKRKTKVEA